MTTIVLEEPDDIVHSASDVRVERGARLVKFRCGESIQDDPDTRASEWTCWSSEVTCDICRLPLPLLRVHFAALEPTCPT